MAITVTVTNKDIAPVSGPVTDLPNGGGFLYDGGKLYVRIGSLTFCPENGNINNVSEFDGFIVPLRDVEYQHAAEFA